MGCAKRECGVGADHYGHGSELSPLNSTQLTVLDGFLRVFEGLIVD